MKDEKKSFQEKGKREKSMRVLVRTWIKSIYLCAGCVPIKAVCIREHICLLLCFLSGKQSLRILSQKLFRFTQECTVLCSELLLGNGHWRITSR